MGKKIKIFSWFVAVFFAIAFLSQAQSKITGTISGSVVDESGAALPGVSITLKGATLFQKSLSTITNEKGIFRFLTLNPGSYDLEVSLAGFNTIKFSNLAISAGITSPIQAVMTQATLAKEVTVVGRAPLIETRTPQVSHNFDSLLVENLPTSRNFQDIMNAAPTFMEGTGFGASGNVSWGGSGISGRWSFALGSMTGSFKLNDVDVSNPGAGYTTINPLYETIAEVQVVGIGATPDTGGFVGGAVNVVTKSGTNDFHGSINATYQDKNFSWKFPSGSHGYFAYVNYDYQTSGTFSGALIKEKLFFFLAGGYQAKEGVYQGYQGQKYSRPNYYAKVDYLLNKKNTLTLLWNANPSTLDQWNDRNPAGLYYMPSTNNTLYASWMSTLSDISYFYLKFAGFRDSILMQPAYKDAGPSYVDQIVGKGYGAFYMDRDYYSQRLQLDGALSYFADELFGYSHEFKVGFEFERSFAGDKRNNTYGGRINNYQFPGDPDVTWWAYTGGDQDPITWVTRFAGHVNDSLKVNKKLTLSLGVRAEFPRVTARGINGPLASFKMISPRLGLTYDLTGDARNVVRASFGLYYNKVINSTFTPCLPGSNELKVYEYKTSRAFYDQFDGNDKQAVLDMLKTIAQPQYYLYSATSTVPIPVDPNLKESGTTQFSVGFQKMFFKDFVLSIDYLWKRDFNAYTLQSAEAGQHTFQSYQWTDPWLSNTITLWQQTDRIADTNWVLTNAPSAKKRHDMIIVQISKRPTQRWSMMFSYVYQNSRTNYPGMGSSDLFGSPIRNFNVDPYYGSQNSLNWGQEWSRPHQFKLDFSWLAPLGIVLSSNFRVMSEMVGQASVGGTSLPANVRMYRSFGSPTVLLEQRGIRQGRLYKSLDVRIAKVVRIFGSRFELQADIFNVFNDNYSYSMNWFYFLTNPQVERKSAGLLPPRNLRLGLAWRF